MYKIIYNLKRIAYRKFRITSNWYTHYDQDAGRFVAIRKDGGKDRAIKRIGDAVLADMRITDPHIFDAARRDR